MKTGLQRGRCDRAPLFNSFELDCAWRIQIKRTLASTIGQQQSSRKDYT